ncbi:MAG: DUF433 domain-containing protein [Patescibacteria group bacterium]
MKKETVLKKKLIPGSKVSISVLIDYISEGYSLTEFLSDYPWIKRDQIEKTLNELKEKDYPVRYAF